MKFATAIRKTPATLCLLLIAGGTVAEVDQPAPAFALPDGSGDVVSLSDYEGQVLLINFWASWCAPCREEMPLLDQLAERYGPLGFTMLGINVEEDSALADRFLEGTPVGFPILYDRENRVSQLYDLIAMPTSILVDRAGQIRFVHHGYEAGNENEYQNQIRLLVRE
jgi:thiol-disulfide isomerase/thioredoxin